MELATDRPTAGAPGGHVQVLVERTLAERVDQLERAAALAREATGLVSAAPDVTPDQLDVDEVLALAVRDERQPAPTGHASPTNLAVERAFAYSAL